MSLPNYLTFIRIFISPIFLVVYLEHDALGVSSIWLPYILLFLLCVSEMSDIFDGFFARRFGQVTDLGKILDPMADSIARISVFLTFTQGVVQLPLLLVFIFLYRDSVVGTLRTVCALRGSALAARPSGKLKAVIQAIVAVCIVLLMIPQSLGYISQSALHWSAIWMVAVAGIYTLFSGADYIYANRAHIKKLLMG
jgi:CDP-diacylglycerol--glycerol-3-phosphate 3-phosphatidyltransferase